MRNLPIVTKSLILANFALWLLTELLEMYGFPLINYLGLFNYSTSYFHWWQPITYMFMHGGFSHLFFNMFAVLMFGPVLEREWGPWRYLIYYIICGLGAAFVQEIVWSLMGVDLSVTIGASGAVFGILLAFGWLFPDVPMYLLFIPIPIKARWMVIGYAVIELFAGFSPLPGDNIAHFAHLGGMLFGLLPLLWWTYKDRIRLPKFFDKFHKVENAKDKDYSDYHYHKRL